MSRTAWTKSSSVPSDRIPPRTPPRTPTPKSNKGKTKENVVIPKSKEVLKLESLVAGLKTGTNSKDPKGSCYCQARLHKLSKYTPICFKCGLVICSLHAPFYACPHCASPLTSPSSCDTLIQSLTDEISMVLTREAEQRERAREELQKAEGAFPTLNGLPPGNNQTAVAQQPRKVLTLNQQTRKVMVSSYVAAPPIRPAPTSHVEEPPEIRISPPPKEVNFVKGKFSEDRRWKNHRDGSITYAPLPSQNRPEGSRSGRRKKKKDVESRPP